MLQNFLCSVKVQDLWIIFIIYERKKIMLFSQMSAAVQPVLFSICQHPFNIELAKGTLSRNKFIYYLEQDALYLAEFFRALTLIGARVKHHGYAKQFLEFALEALNAEKILHADYLRHYTSRSV